jgi:hypothetical protein
MRVRKWFYVASVAGGAILGIVLYETGVPGGNIPWIYATAIALVLLYKAWKAIQDGQARTTPGWAVGLLFVPFYNFYWIFQAYWGLAKDYNSYISRHDISTSRLPEGLFLAYSIIPIIVVGLLIWLVRNMIESMLRGMMPTAAYVILQSTVIIYGVINVIILTIIAVKLCDAVNSLPLEAES